VNVAAAHHDPSGWAALLSYWWLFLIFGGAILEWIADTYNAGLRALARRRRDRRKHELRMAKIQLEIAQAGNVTAIGQKKTPGPCVHRNVVPVLSSDGLESKVVAWLCKSCDARLPADWAVREEDL
jgi:hypothetical protein